LQLWPSRAAEVVLELVPELQYQWGDPRHCFLPRLDSEENKTLTSKNKHINKKQLKGENLVYAVTVVYKLK